jgi:hypothetical protein
VSGEATVSIGGRKRSTLKANGVIGWKLLQRMAKMLREVREG